LLVDRQRRFVRAQSVVDSRRAGRHRRLIEWNGGVEAGQAQLRQM
jgi:hypothetical protein